MALAHATTSAVDEEAARAFLERVDPVIWTPASQKGVPLSVDPVDPGLAELPADERLRAQSRTAARIVGLLGWDLDADEGAAPLRPVRELVETDEVRWPSRPAAYPAYFPF